MNKEELQEQFWNEAGEHFGYDIIGSDTHPLKEAFELYCKMKETKLIATRVECFDSIDDQNYGSRPYAVVLDVYSMEGNFIENGTDWYYFKTKEEAEEFINKYNKNK